MSLTKRSELLQLILGSVQRLFLENKKIRGKYQHKINCALYTNNGSPRLVIAS